MKSRKRKKSERPVGGSQPEEMYGLATRKNMFLDRPTSHGGWPEGEYDPPVNDRIYNYLKSMGMIQERVLRNLIREVLLSEGGLKLPPEHRRDLTPALVREAVAIYSDFIAGFNDWLQSSGKLPIDPTYGEIDYLVSFPVNYTSEDLTARRKEEAAAVREYTNLLVEYMTTVRPSMVDVDLTIAGHPLMIIIKLPSGGLAQVDTVVTHPTYAEWMRGRYTPERGIKGYVTGNLYKALGDYFTLSIGTEGVLARLKDGQRVSSKLRSGVTYKNISTDFTTFLKDIASYIIGSDEYTPDRLLLQHPGLNPDEPSVGDLATGIVGLSRTLEAAGILDSQEMLATIYDNFVLGMDENVSRKLSKDITPEMEEKMRKLGTAQAARVRNIFSI